MFLIIIYFLWKNMTVYKMSYSVEIISYRKMIFKVSELESFFYFRDLGGRSDMAGIWNRMAIRSLSLLSSWIS